MAGGAILNKYKDVNMTNKHIPYPAIWGVIKYMHDDELRHFCECLLDGDADDHIYRHVLALVKWLAMVPVQSTLALSYLDEALARIEEAKAESKAA